MSSHLIDGHTAGVSELICLPWVQSASCHGFTNSIFCLKYTGGISVRGLIDSFSHLWWLKFLVHCYHLILLHFLDSTLIKIILFIPVEAFLFVDITYISRAHPAECPSWCVFKTCLDSTNWKVSLKKKETSIISTVENYSCRKRIKKKIIV